MKTVRALLDCLGREPLLRLMSARALTSARDDQSRREALVRSYRGNVSQFLDELQRTDLITIFRSASFVNAKGEQLHLPAPASHLLAELRAFAQRAFVETSRRLPKAFVVRATDADDTLPSDPPEEEEEDEALEDEPDDGEALARLLLNTVTDKWSVPVPIRGVIRALNYPPLERLRTARFQLLLGELESLDIEACLENEPEKLLDDDSLSPGMVASLRLRRRFEEEEAPSGPAAREPRSAERGPVIEVAQEAPVQRGSHRPADYNLALLKLQFLTAVPSVERRSHASWPGDYLDAATEGLALRPQELAVLKAYAQGLVVGIHSAFDSIPQLAQALSVPEWDSLIATFERLNSFQPEVVRVIVEEVAVFASPRLLVVAAERQEEATRPGRRTIAVPLSKDVGGRAPKEVSVARPVEDNAAKNVRSMGALDSMFDDE